MTNNALLGLLLAVSQFSLAALLVLSSRMTPICFACWSVVVGGAWLWGWSWHVLGERTQILPQVKKETSLVTQHPYRFIRHPMYTGLALFCLGLLLTNFLFWRVVTWVLLAVILDAKSRSEERSLGQRFGEYQGYQRRSWRFLPLVY